VCRVLGQHQSTQRTVPCGADDELALTEDIIVLAGQYGRYGYRRVGYRPPAPAAATPPLPASGSASLHLRPAMAAETTMH